VKSDADPKLTFWSVPPFRQNAIAVARKIKVREARLLLAQFYGTLYFLWGMKAPALLILASPLGLTDSQKADFLLKVGLHAAIVGLILCGLGGAFAGAVATWIIAGRGIRARKRNRLQWAAWGAIGAAAPAVCVVAVVGANLLFVITGIVLLLFGAAQGAAFHWVVGREQPKE